MNSNDNITRVLLTIIIITIVIVIVTIVIQVFTVLMIMMECMIHQPIHKDHNFTRESDRRIHIQNL